MSTWKDEFDRRCRRVMGVADDSLSVTVETATYHWSTLTGDETVVTLTVGSQSREFLWMSDLIRALDEVEP